MRIEATYDKATGEIRSIRRVSSSRNGLIVRNRPGEASIEIKEEVDPLAFDVVNGQLQRRNTPRPPRTIPPGSGIIRPPGRGRQGRGRPGNGRNS